MALILAIEGDRRQATLLATIGRRVGAELVIAPSAERGLEAIDGRVPDLILTSALLSPHDDAAIATRLRELDTAASHVQMLTIPLLAKTARRQASSGGLLGKLRGGASDATPDGCDPALFAEQVREYLDRAAAERTAHDEAEHARPTRRGNRAEETAIHEAISDESGPTILDTPTVDAVGANTSGDASAFDHEAPVVVEAPTVIFAEVHPQPDHDDRVSPDVLQQSSGLAEESAIHEIAAEENAAHLASEPIASAVSPERAVESVIDEQALEPSPVSTTMVDADVMLHAPAIDEPVVVPPLATASEPDPTVEPEPLTIPEDDKTSDAEIELADELDDEPDVVELNASAAGTDVETALREFEAALAEAESPDGRTREAQHASADQEADIPVIELSADGDVDASTVEIWTELSRAAAAWPPLEGETGDEAIDNTVNAAAAADAISGAIAPIQGDTTATEASPRPDAKRAEPRESPKHRPGDALKQVDRKRRRPRPAQDEWGLFDPEQCGFAALLEKLDEIASADDAA